MIVLLPMIHWKWIAAIWKSMFDPLNLLRLVSDLPIVGLAGQEDETATNDGLFWTFQRQSAWCHEVHQHIYGLWLFGSVLDMRILNILPDSLSSFR